MKGEKWKAVPGAPGYEVSNMGRVRSYHQRKGRAWHIGEEPRRILQESHKDGSWYPGVNIMFDHGRRHMRVASLVLLVFEGPCPDGLEICHKDGDVSNSRLKNLRYDTREANIEDMKRHLAEKRGDEIKAIRERYATGECARAIGDDFGYSERYIRSIGSGQTLSYMPGPITKGYRNLKVTMEQREDIRRIYAGGGWTLKELGRLFGISESHCSRIINNKVAKVNR